MDDLDEGLRIIEESEQQAERRGKRKAWLWAGAIIAALLLSSASLVFGVMLGERVDKNTVLNQVQDDRQKDFAVWQAEIEAAQAAESQKNADAINNLVTQFGGAVTKEQMATALANLPVGSSVTPQMLADAIATIPDPPPGPPGPPGEPYTGPPPADGADGENGQDGKDGANGQNGSPGDSLALMGSSPITGGCGVTLHFVQTIGVTGEQTIVDMPVPVPCPRSITSTVCNATDGTWTISYSDGTIENVTGPCIGQPYSGPPPADGKDGTVTPGTYSCSGNQVLQGIIVASDGSVTPICVTPKPSGGP